LLPSGFDPVVLIDEEGVGETSDQRPDSTSARRSRLAKRNRQKKQVFFARADVQLSAISLPAPVADVRSGPDVFADALVPAAERAASGIRLPGHHCLIAPGASRVRAMVIHLRKPQGKPFAAGATKPDCTIVSRISRARAASLHLHPVHRDA
jgi:hypothetical protein